MTPPRARNNRDEAEKEESESSELGLESAERCERKGHGIENGAKLMLLSFAFGQDARYGGVSGGNEAALTMVAMCVRRSGIVRYWKQ